MLGSSVALIGPGPLGVGADLSANGPLGGGSILIGGDRAGAAPIPTAQQTVVDDYVTIEASALQNGDGGSIVVWSDGGTTYHGDSSALGAGTGVGGFIETSGKATLDNEGTVDVSGPGGDGEVLLDPLVFTVVPAGVFSPLTAIDDADAFANRTTPSVATQGTELVGNLFCELLDVSTDCGPTQAPSLQDYQNNYNTKNQLVIDLARIPQLRSIRPRAWFTFISTPTLEEFTGSIEAQGIFGIQLLPDAPSTFGLASSDTGLDLVNQGPGDTVTFESFFSVVTIGRITLGGGDLTLQAGDPAPAAEIDAILDDVVDGGTAALNSDFLQSFSFSSIVQDGIDNSLGSGTNEDTLVDLIDLVDLLSGGNLPPVTRHLPGVFAIPPGPSNIAASIRMLDALGAPIPDWLHDVADVADQIDEYTSLIPTKFDLLDLALGGVTIPGIPGIPGIEIPRVCIAYESDGHCYATPLRLLDGIWVERTCNGRTQPRGRCPYLVDPIASFHIPGVCAIDPANIPCSINDLINKGLLPLVESALEDALPSELDELLGSAPDILQIPDLSAASRQLPSLLYVDSEISTPGGTVNLVNSSARGATLLGDVITADTINVDAQFGSVVNRRVNASAILGVLGVSDIPAGVPANATLAANNVNIIAESGIGSSDAPIGLRQLTADGLTVDISTDTGVAHLENDRPLTLSGTIETNSGARFVSRAPADLRDTTIDVGSDFPLTYVVDGGDVDIRAETTARQIDVEGNGGSDAVRVHPFESIPVSIDLGNGADTIVFDSREGGYEQQTAQTISVDGYQDIEFDNVERIEGLIPNALTAVGPELVDEGELYTAEVDFIDWGADSWNIVVDWGDGSTSTTTHTRTAEQADQAVVTAVIEHHFPDNGSYDITIDVVDALDSGSDQTTTSVSVSNVPPQIDTGPDQPLHVEGVAVTLDSAIITDAGAADTHVVRVNWGDGSPLETADVRDLSGTGDIVFTAIPVAEHFYANDGDYSVTVCVTDDDQATRCDIFGVTVANTAPTITVDEDRVTTEGTTVELLATSFNDPGTADTHTATIDWGDGTPVEPATVTETPFAPGTAEGLTGSLAGAHVYADNGGYTVTACVTDHESEVCDTFAVVIGNAAPTLNLAITATGDEGTEISLGDTTFNDLGTADTHTATIDWGEAAAAIGDEASESAPAVVEELTIVAAPFGPPGTTDGLTGSLESTYVYTNDGVYDITVCVTDDDQAVAGEAPVCETVGIEIADQLATINAGPDRTIEEGRFLLLDDAIVNDPGILDRHTATVFWGDERSQPAEISYGETPEAGSTTGIDATVSISEHRYFDDGIYNANVCVNDEELTASSTTDLNPSALNCDEVVVTVENVAPQVITDRASVSQSEGSPISWNATPFSDLGPFDEHTATIDYGDGSELQAVSIEYNDTSHREARSGRVAPITYTYVDDGRYVAITCILDDDEGESCTERSVRIRNVAPSIRLADQTVSGVERSAVELPALEISDPGVADEMTVTVDWGDQESSTYEIGLDRSFTEARHSYRTEGVFEVTVCVQDGVDSTCDRLEATIDDAPAPPLESILSPTRIVPAAPQAPPSLPFADNASEEADVDPAVEQDGTDELSSASDCADDPSCDQAAAAAPVRDASESSDSTVALLSAILGLTLVLFLLLGRGPRKRFLS